MNSSAFGGAVILTGRDFAIPIMDAMVLALRHMFPDPRLSMVMREKTRGNMVIDLGVTEDIAALESIRAIDYFSVGTGDSFSTPLIVPAMRKDIRQTLLGEPDFGRFANFNSPLNAQDQSNQLCKLLANLSSLTTAGDEDNSFAEKVRSTIFNVLEGRYSAGLFLNGAKSNIILANRDYSRIPSVGMLITKKCVALVWYSDQELCAEFARTIREIEAHDSNIQPVLIPLNTIRNSMLVIHPLHISSKWVRAGKNTKAKNPNNPYVAINIISKYIFQSTLSL